MEKFKQHLPIHSNANVRQLMRFIIVGCLSNGVAYLVYAWLSNQCKPIVAMSWLYLIGFCLSFLGNKRFTFQDNSRNIYPLLRFSVMHIVLFGFQYCTHFYLHSVVGLPHLIVQAGLMIVVGCLSFVVSRTFVFRLSVT
jgi:putative flippase GtrA